MKSKIQISKVLNLAGMGAVVYILLKYQNTVEFKNAMRFLLSPKSDQALPQIWQDYRMLVIFAVFLLLMFYYRSVYFGYRRFSQILRGSVVLDVRPQIPLIQSAYYFQQDKVRCLLAWVMQLCDQGGLTLRYTKGAHPWALGYKRDAQINSVDQERIKTLFGKGDSVILKSWMESPNTEMQALSYELIKEVGRESKGKSQKQKKSWLAWLILIGLIAEIPFYSASLEGEHVALLPMVVFSTLLTSIPAYAFSYVFFLLFTESKVMGYFMMAVSFIFPLIGIAVIFSADRFSGLYFLAAFFPGLVLSLVILIMKQPLLPQDESELAQIVGYRKYLAEEGYRIREDDLPWSVSLAVHFDIMGNEFSYAGQNFPKWLETEEADVQTVMKYMHQSLQPALNEAVNGEVKSKGRLSSSRSSSHRF